MTPAPLVEALKPKKVAGIQAWVLSAAEVLHGPVTLMRPGVLALVLTQDDVIGNSVEMLGLTLADAVDLASAVPARLLGLDDRGAIRAGMVADLVALEGTAVTDSWISGAHSSEPRSQA